MSILGAKPISATCPVCHYGLAIPFFDGGEQPLATLGWSHTSCEAVSMPRYPLRYVQCPRCTHIWNHVFSYDSIPYSDSPNRMFNRGVIWGGHLSDTRNFVMSKLPRDPVVIDIGCGDGHFVRGLADSLFGSGRFVGFDPNTSQESGVGIEFYNRYFDPMQDIETFSPDVLVMRHVLEHFTDPMDFVGQLAWSASKISKPVFLFAEVPCVDKVFESRRLVDFFYEHPSQFSTRSFTTLLSHAGKIHEIDHGYNGEVVYGMVELAVLNEFFLVGESANEFYTQSVISMENIKRQLSELASSGKTVAIWGGTGKAAAFIHFFNADASRFPLVVDSDVDKVGTFVPKTGQRIQFRDVLKTFPVDVVIIPAQWRARDIVGEMSREGITVSTILIEHLGELVDFRVGVHPY